MISIKNITKKFSKDIIALKNVNFDIARGEFLFLTGKSGSGKSTLFKILYKDEIPTEGDVFLFGKNTKKTRTKNLRRKMGIVFQDYKLLNNKTVYDNVSYPLSCLGVNPVKVRKETMKVLKMMNIADLIKKKPEELSGGEQQRVAIARAIINKPEILLCDEPTGNLDSENTWIIMKHLQELNDAGTTIVMTTHSEEIVEKMKKRVITLEKGEVVNDTALTKQNSIEYKTNGLEKNKINILKEIGFIEEDAKIVKGGSKR